MSDQPASPSSCKQCGAPLPAATAGLCPRCLMAQIILPTQDGAPAAPMPILSAEELAPYFPQLEILECLGRGGMGVVYKARQKTLNRIVALKLLAPERVTDAKFAERFAHEAQALAALNHPSIVTIHDFGQAGGFYYLLMEFVDGVNLRQAMKAGRFTPEQALAVVPPVCEALQYAHEHGIVHRDIKPENLLLDKEGRVKIADFGIAKMLGAPVSEPAASLSEANPPNRSSALPAEPTLASLAGTPQYMAPEQKAHRATDHRADIYSLGVVLYELLTGELPADKLQPPSRKVQIDVRLDEIVLRALEKSPELRYQTAGEFRTQVVTVTGRSTPEELPGLERTRATSDVSASSTWLPYLGLFAVLAGLWWTYLWWHDPVEGRSMRPVGVIVAVVGLFLMLKGLIQAARSPGTPPAAAAAASLAGNREPRFSRAAIVGACWAPFFFAAAAFLSFEPHASKADRFPSGYTFIATLLIFLSLAACFGTTMLGWIAVSQIRRSAGRLHGLGLAVFDGLLFPMLALDGVLWWFWRIITGMVLGGLAKGRGLNGYDPAHMPPDLAAWISVSGIILVLVVDFLIIRAVWGAVNGAVSQSPGRRPPGTIALCLAGLSGVLGGIAFTQMPEPNRALVISVFATSLLGMVVAIPAVRHGRGKWAFSVATLNLAIWLACAATDMDAQRSSASGRSARLLHGAYVSRNNLSVMSTQDDRDVHHVFFYEGSFTTSSDVRGDKYSLVWLAKGSISLRGGRTFGYSRESVSPDTLAVNGRDYDLRRGRVLVLHDDGTAEQLCIFPTLAAANNPEEIAKLVAAAREMNAEPITVEKLRQQLEASEAQLRDVLRTHAPTHPFVIEVRESIEGLKQRIANAKEPGLEATMRKPIPPEAVAVMDAIRALPKTFVFEENDPDPAKSIRAAGGAKTKELVALLRGTEGQPFIERGEALQRELLNATNPPDAERSKAIRAELKELEEKVWALAHPPAAKGADARSGRLQFRLVAGADDADAESVDSHDGKQQFRLRREVLLYGSAVADAKVTGTGDRTTIEVIFNDVDGRWFAEFTAANVGKQLAVVFDGKVLIAPTIQSAIAGGRLQITGRFTAEEAETIAAAIAPPRTEPAKSDAPKPATGDPVPDIEAKATQQLLERTLTEMSATHSKLAEQLLTLKESHPVVVALKTKLKGLEQEAERLRAILRRDATQR